MPSLPRASIGLNATFRRLQTAEQRYISVLTDDPRLRACKYKQPVYAPLEPTTVEQRNESDEERGRGRFRSLFPGVYITTTVEGPYQNIRRFIRELETGNEFVVISSVELAPSESSAGTTRSSGSSASDNVTIDPITGQPVQTRPDPGVSQGPRGRTLGERVALRLEMAAYFRRNDMDPTDISVPPAQDNE